MAPVRWGLVALLVMMGANAQVQPHYALVLARPVSARFLRSIDPPDKDTVVFAEIYQARFRDIRTVYGEFEPPAQLTAEVQVLHKDVLTKERQVCLYLEIKGDGTVEVLHRGTPNRSVCVPKDLHPIETLGEEFQGFQSTNRIPDQTCATVP